MLMNALMPSKMLLKMISLPRGATKSTLGVLMPIQFFETIDFEMNVFCELVSQQSVGVISRNIS